MRIEDKLTILADAAKYDVSCSSSGSRRTNAGNRLGNAAPGGICHTYTEDGRCVSLLKILFSNLCVYDCAYCINRCSNDIPRASFTSREVVALTIDFYRRNYIEGLFLSSGIIRSPNDTMERLVRTVRMLRTEGFNGYIHLKCVPHASRRLIRDAGRYADRLSVNIELPSETSLKRLAQEKTYASVLDPMQVIRDRIDQTREDRRRLRRVPSFAPAGQSTQLIIGASPESDYDILHLSDRLYRQHTLKRVYYSAYVPVPGTPEHLPDIVAPPLQRENRLYQADWLVRLYGFAVGEIISAESPWLDLDLDPKHTFALRHPEMFPIDINHAAYEMILRVPGIGIKSAQQIVRLRRKGRIRIEHLKALGAVVSRARPYICCDGLPAVHWQGAAIRPGVKPPRVLANTVRSTQPTTREMHRVFETDGSFEGLLTAIFNAYTQHMPPDAIVPRGGRQSGLFEQRIPIATHGATAERVWRGLKKHLGLKRRQKLFDAFLTGHPGVETMIYQLIADTIRSGRAARPKAPVSALIQIDKLSQKVRREAHRMKGFIRFKQTGNNQYLALVAPRYDVLPLIRRHFEARYADQQWMIYDTRRNYGICYDRKRTMEVKLDQTTLNAAVNVEHLEDALCQMLWQRYYDAVNIQQRNNPTLHLRQLPRRYWQYLTEKHP